MSGHEAEEETQPEDVDAFFVSYREVTSGDGSFRFYLTRGSDGREVLGALGEETGAGGDSRVAYRNAKNFTNHGEVYSTDKRELTTWLDGVVAVHSLSKRSNLAGARVGFYAGDPDLVTYLGEVRKHVGLMVPGPAQAAGVAALDDDEHVAVQRDRYSSRLEAMAEVLSAWSGIGIGQPAGGFYLWFPVDDAWAFAERLMAEAGALVSPGEFYGESGAGFVRVAVVQSDERIALVARRLAGSTE
jgi:aspartate/methionine/tyrosine aminotransferase